MGICDFSRHVFGVLLLVYCVALLFSIVALFDDFEFGAAASIVGVFLGMLLMLAVTHGTVEMHRDLAEEQRLRQKLQQRMREQEERIAALFEDRDERE